MNEKKWSPFDGIIGHNPVFCAGMSLAPVIIMGVTLRGALVYAAIFSLVTLPSLMICSFYPKGIPYAIRIILYSITAALVYIPVYCLLDGFFGAELSAVGVFLPMIVTGEFMTSASEMRFFRMKRIPMAIDIISHIGGFDIAVIFLGAFRELFSQGGIDGELYGITTVLPLLSSPCGGFILIGLMCALIRLCTS